MTTLARMGSCKIWGKLNSATAPSIALVILILEFSIKPKRKILHVLLGRLFIVLCRRAGGGLVKLAQIVSTRSDLCSPHFIDVISAMQDRIACVRTEMALAGLEETTRKRLSLEYEVYGEECQACGSVAAIFLGMQRATRKKVAIKIINPGSKARTINDMMALRRISRWIARLPYLRSIPITGAMCELTRSVILQFNMHREYKIHAEMKERYDLELIIPIPIGTIDRNVLVMEWISDIVDVYELKEMEIISHTETLLRCLYKMIFVDGCVHCDLHPGNFLSASGKPVLIDFGLSVRVSKENRVSLAKFFLAMLTNDACSGADVIIESASTKNDAMDRGKFEEEVAQFFSSFSGSVVGQFNLSSMMWQLFRLQAEFAIKMSSDFSMPIFALGVFEGHLKRTYPELDFQRESLPYVLHSLGEAW